MSRRVTLLYILHWTAPYWRNRPPVHRVRAIPHWQDHPPATTIINSGRTQLQHHIPTLLHSLLLPIR
ncbi:hypothetical protein LINPERHAP2_LOCUS4026 [Linum perenne]